MSEANQGIVAFLKKKLVGHSLSGLLLAELEGYSLWLFKNWPGVAGFFLRNAVLSVLCRRKSGMVWLQSEVNLVYVGRMKLGSNIGINSGTYLNALGGLELGNHVLIGSNVTISAGRHPIEGRFPSVYERPCEPLKIIIEDDVWIGAGAVIMPGITLRKGTVVGANSVVTKSTEEYDIVVGAPAKRVRKRTDVTSIPNSSALI
jgi:maltose O-acetyltransferase